jgi:hypothetical protein
MVISPLNTKYVSLNRIWVPSDEVTADTSLKAAPGNRQIEDRRIYTIRLQNFTVFFYFHWNFTHTALRVISVIQSTTDQWKIFRYEGVSKSFRTGRLERELQMVQLFATVCSCIAVLWVILVSFATITLCVASQRVFVVVVVYFIMTQSGNFWIHPRMYVSLSW